MWILLFFFSTYKKYKKSLECLETSQKHHHRDRQRERDGKLKQIVCNATLNTFRREWWGKRKKSTRQTTEENQKIKLHEILVGSFKKADYLQANKLNYFLFFLQIFFHSFLHFISWFMKSYMVQLKINEQWTLTHNFSLILCFILVLFFFHMLKFLKTLRLALFFIWFSFFHI